MISSPKWRWSSSQSTWECEWRWEHCKTYQLMPTITHWLALLSVQMKHLTWLRFQIVLSQNQLQAHPEGCCRKCSKPSFPIPRECKVMSYCIRVRTELFTGLYLYSPFISSHSGNCRKRKIPWNVQKGKAQICGCNFEQMLMRLRSGREGSAPWSAIWQQ